MLTAYFDDSGIGQPPVSVLAGWVAPAATWAHFSDEWAAALSMSPRLHYFKYSEAKSLSGQFDGWSNERRDERVKMLANIIAEHKPLGIGGCISHDLYRRVFPSNFAKPLNFPYMFLFCGAVMDLARNLPRENVTEKVDFIFDIQPGQVDIAWASWTSLLEIMPETRSLIADYPIFRDDQNMPPLHAADLAAGNLRERAVSVLAGKEEPTPIWGNSFDHLRAIFRVYDEEQMKAFCNAVPTLQHVFSSEQSS